MLSSSIKFTSYNVLSSHLSEPTYFLACNPAWLDPDYRLKLLKSKLDAEVKDNAVICLQEVSHKWAGVLHAYFSERGYHLVTGLYGVKFNGYMGVAVAVPTAKYEVVDVDITRIADTKRMQRKPKPGFVQNIFNKISKFLFSLAVELGFAKQSFDFWDNVLYRTNQMVCLRLADKTDKKRFVVGNYHMPCMFRKPAGERFIPQSLTNLRQLCANPLCVVGSDGDPLRAVCPAHPALRQERPFRLLRGLQHQARLLDVPAADAGQTGAQGQLTCSSIVRVRLTPCTTPCWLLFPVQHPDYPEIEAGDSWTPEVKPPLSSAYVTATGREPDFTNYAKVQNDPVFIETLDYLFHSKGWRVDSVLPLPHRDTVAGPLPNESEPSDHILVSAKMSLV